jgi:hypothetical protein
VPSTLSYGPRRHSTTWFTSHCGSTHCHATNSLPSGVGHDVGRQGVEEEPSLHLADSVRKATLEPLQLVGPLVGEPLRELGACHHVDLTQPGLLEQLTPSALDRRLAGLQAALWKLPAARRVGSLERQHVREVGRAHDDHDTGTEVSARHPSNRTASRSPLPSSTAC